MNLTNEYMSQYIGGQLEIVGGDGLSHGSYRYRGQINAIQIIPSDSEPSPVTPGQQATLHVEFDYICKFDAGVGYQPDELKPYDISLCISAVSEIGRGPYVEEGPPRLCVNCPIVNEMSVFYPPQHNKRVLANGDMQKDGEY